MRTGSKIIAWIAAAGTFVGALGNVGSAIVAADEFTRLQQASKIVEGPCETYVGTLIYELEMLELELERLQARLDETKPYCDVVE